MKWCILLVGAVAESVVIAVVHPIAQARWAPHPYRMYGGAMLGEVEIKRSGSIGDDVVAQTVIFVGGVWEPDFARTVHWSRPTFADGTVLGGDWPGDEFAPGIVAWSPDRAVMQAARNMPWDPTEGLMLGSSYEAQTYGYGWPFVSSASDYADHSMTPRALSGIPMGLTTARGWDRVVPTRVVRSGMAANVAVYASVLLAFGVCVSVWCGVWRRHARWGRGVCGRCRYEVCDLDVCPECGAPRPAQERTARARWVMGVVHRLGVFALVAAVVVVAHPVVVALTVPSRSSASPTPVMVAPASDVGTVEFIERLWIQDRFASDGRLLGPETVMMSYAFSGRQRPARTQHVAWGVPARTLSVLTPEFATNPDVTVLTSGYGWPWVSIASDRDVVGGSWVHGIEAGSFADGTPRGVPTRVVWAGAVTNGVLYTLAIGLCVGVVLVLREHRRGSGRVR